MYGVGGIQYAARELSGTCGNRRYNFEILDENRPIAQTRNEIQHEDLSLVCSEQISVEDNEQFPIWTRKRKSSYSHEGRRDTHLSSKRYIPTRIHDPVCYTQAASVSLDNNTIDSEPVTPQMFLEYPITDDPDKASTTASSSKKSTPSSESVLSTATPYSSISLSESTEWVGSEKFSEDLISKGRSTSAEPTAGQRIIHQQIPAHFEQTSLNFDHRNASTIIDPSPRDQGNWAGESWIYSPILRPADRITTLSQYPCEFEVHCDLLSFMQRHFGEDSGSSTLGSVISLSGSARKAQATTAAEYLKSHWSETGQLTLDALQCAFNSEHHIFKVSHAEPNIDFDVCISKTICLRVVGSERSIREISRQLEWIGCAFRFSDGDRIEYSTAIQDSDHPTVIRFQQKPVPSNDDEFGCWFPLFTNAVIVHGFPVASRANDEEGLELSFDVMIALSGVQYSAIFKGGTILKGFSSMLIPTVSYDDSVQWHFWYSHTGDQLDYSEVPDKQRVLVSEIDMQKKRAFLGWCERAEIHLGTRGTKYTELKCSSALEPGEHMTWSGVAPSFNAGIFNTGIGLTFQLKFGARDGNIHFSREGSLQKIIGWAEKMPVILYEPEEMRGWLVPASGVILHMLHTRLVKTPCESGGLPIESTYADPTRNGPRAAFVALRSLVSPGPISSTDISKKYNGKAALNQPVEIILEIWGMLDVCLKETRERNQAAGTALPNLRTVFQGSQKLQGYEYMDIVDQDSSVRLKQKTIKTDHGGWVDLAKDIDCLVLFGCGFKDIIKPAPKSIPCQSWEKLPEGNDYLAASAAIIWHLSDRAGSRPTLKNLTTKLDPIQWRVPQGSKLFEKCEQYCSHPCRCKRLQRLVRQRNFGNTSPPTDLKIEGAILFGGGANKLTRNCKPSRVTVPEPSNIATSSQSGDTNPPTFTSVWKTSVSLAATSLDEEWEGDATQIQSAESTTNPPIFTPVQGNSASSVATSLDEELKCNTMHIQGPESTTNPSFFTPVLESSVSSATTPLDDEFMGDAMQIQSPESTTNPPTFTPILGSSAPSAATSPNEGIKGDAMQIQGPDSNPQPSKQSENVYLTPLPRRTKPPLKVSLESEKHAGHEGGSENSAPAEPLTEDHSVKCEDGTPPKEKPPKVLHGHNRSSSSNLRDMSSLPAKREDNGLQGQGG
ncbi:hypothetical protein MMC11_008297 [Xylographa trunciseda]|nr:hypothetical protein [Xylographa trunciseda]